MSDEYKFRKVNAILGASPKIGPFPTELIIPWAIISFTLFMICYVFLNMSWHPIGFYQNLSLSPDGREVRIGIGT